MPQTHVLSYQDSKFNSQPPPVWAACSQAGVLAGKKQMPKGELSAVRGTGLCPGVVVGLVAPDLAAEHVPHQPHAEAVQVLRSQFVKDRPTRTVAAAGRRGKDQAARSPA